MAWRDFAARFETGALQRAVERDVEAEIEAHLAEAAAALEVEGLAPDEARARARQRFGDFDKIRAECLRIRMGGLHAMNKLLVGALIVVTLALLATITGSYWLYARARMAQGLAMAARTQALEAEQRAHESEAQALPQEITVAIGDELELVESMHPELQLHTVVQSDGKALFPEVGWVDVAGLSREQVEERLRQQFAPFYEELKLFVIVHKAGTSAPARCLKAPITTFTAQFFGRF